MEDFGWIRLLPRQGLKFPRLSSRMPSRRSRLLNDRAVFYKYKTIPENQMDPYG